MSDMNVQYTNLSSTNNAYFTWEFGDGNDTYQYSPTHTFSESGTYTTCLYITVIDSSSGGSCKDSYCETITISNVDSTSNDSTSISVNDLVSPIQNCFVNEQNNIIINLKLTELSDNNIQVFGLGGKLVYQHLFSPENLSSTIKISSQVLSTGVYIIHVANKHGNFTSKVMLK